MVRVRTKSSSPAKTTTATGTAAQLLPAPLPPAVQPDDHEHDQRCEQVRPDGRQEPVDEPDARGDHHDHREHPNQRVLAELLQRHSSNLARASSFKACCSSVSTL